MDIKTHPPRECMVPRRLEPRTLRLLAVRSDQLSYETSEASGEQQDISMRLKLGSRRCGDQERTGPIRPVLAPMGGESIRTSKKKLGGEPKNIKKLCAMGIICKQVHMNMALCQPSERSLVPRGLEPRTSRLLAVRSDQLSYETNEKS